MLIGVVEQKQCYRRVDFQHFAYACGAGTLLCYLGCLLSGARFKPFGIVVGMFFDNGLMLAAAIVLALAILVFFLRTRRPLESLIGVVLLLTLLSIVSLAALGENMLFLVLYNCSASRPSIESKRRIRRPSPRTGTNRPQPPKRPATN